MVENSVEEKFHQDGMIQEELRSARSQGRSLISLSSHSDYVHVTRDLCCSIGLPIIISHIPGWVRAAPKAILGVPLDRAM